MSSVRVELCVAAGLADTFALNAVHYGLVYHVRQSRGTRTDELLVYQPFRGEDGYFRDLPGVQEDRARMEQERGSESELDRCLVRKSAFVIDPSALRAPVAGTLQRVFVLLRPQGGELLSRRLGLSLALRAPELQRTACSDEGVSLKPLWSDAEWRADRTAEAVPFGGDLARYIEALTAQANRVVDVQDAAPETATWPAPPRREPPRPGTTAAQNASPETAPKEPVGPPSQAAAAVAPASANRPRRDAVTESTAAAGRTAPSRRFRILLLLVVLAAVAGLVDRYTERWWRRPQSAAEAPLPGARVPEPSSAPTAAPPAAQPAPVGRNKAALPTPPPSPPVPQSERPAPAAAPAPSVPARAEPGEAAPVESSPPTVATETVPPIPAPIDPAGSARIGTDASSVPVSPQQAEPAATPPSRPKADRTAVAMQAINVPQGSSASTLEDLSVFVYEEHDSAIHALLDTVRPNDRNAFARRLQWLRANVPATPAPGAQLRGRRETFDAQLGALVAQADRAGDRAALRRAVALSERFLQSNFGDAPAHRNHALALVALGDGSAALQAGFYAIAFDPEAPGGYLATGLAFARAGYGQLAVDAFCVALRTGGYAPTLLADIERIRRGEDFDFAAARTAIQDIDQRCPRDRWGG